MKVTVIAAFAVACAMLLPAAKASAANRRKHMSGFSKSQGLKTTLGPRGRNMTGAQGLGQSAPAQSQAQYQTPQQSGKQAQNQAQPQANQDATADGSNAGVQPVKPRPRSRTGH